MLNMLLSSLQLTIAGMSVVFGFLITMVLTINLMSFVVLKYFPEKTESVPEETITENTVLVAAIVAAVKNINR